MKFDDDTGFCIADNGKPIEGFLGDEEKADILFILREPNDGNPKKFWLREILSKDYMSHFSTYKGKEIKSFTHNETIFIDFYHPCYSINKEAFCKMLGIKNSI